MCARDVGKSPVGTGSVPSSEQEATLYTLYSSSHAANSGQQIETESHGKSCMIMRVAI